MRFEFILLPIQSIYRVSGARIRWHQLPHHNAYIECYWQLYSLYLDKCHERWTQTNKRISERTIERIKRAKKNYESYYHWHEYLYMNITQCTMHTQSSVRNRHRAGVSEGVLHLNGCAVRFRYNSTKHLDISHCIMCIDAFLFHLNSI